LLNRGHFGELLLQGRFTFRLGLGTLAVAEMVGMLVRVGGTIILFLLLTFRLTILSLTVLVRLGVFFLLLALSLLALVITGRVAVSLGALARLAVRELRFLLIRTQILFLCDMISYERIIYRIELHCGCCAVYETSTNVVLFSAQPLFETKRSLVYMK
jgi:hypothetical protein